MVHSESKRKANNRNVSTTQVPQPPDGGYGWVIVTASFLIHIITDGIGYSLGILYVALLADFNEGKGYTSSILSVAGGMTLCIGPVSSIFVNKYGCRVVTIAGAILASACFAVSFYAQNVLTLIITIGFGLGCGLGLIYLPAIVCVSTHFEKKRSLAIGIAVAGSGVGTFLFAPLVSLWTEKLGWRHTMLVLSVIILFCAVIAILFRELSASTPKTKECDQEDQMPELEPMQKQETNLSQVPPKNFVFSTIPEEVQMTRSQSVGHNMNGRKIRSKGIPEDTRGMLSQPVLTSAGLPSVYENRPFSESRRSSSNSLSRPDVFYQSSIANIPECKSQMQLSTEMESVANRLENGIEPSTKKICGCIPADSDAFLDMLNFDLLTNPVFVIFALSNFFTCLGFHMPYFCLADKAKGLGLSTTEASYLLSTIGVANTVGRIILGYISDKPWTNRNYVYNGCLLTCGLATVGSVFCVDFWSLAVYSGIYGFFIGAYIGLTSVILVDLLGIGKLTNAFGLVLLFQGLASFIGTPIAGFLFDQTQSYVPGFLFAGSMIALSGIMLFFIPTLQRYLARRKSQQADIVMNTIVDEKCGK